MQPDNHSPGKCKDITLILASQKPITMGQDPLANNNCRCSHFGSFLCCLLWLPSHFRFRKEGLTKQQDTGGVRALQEGPGGLGVQGLRRVGNSGVTSHSSVVNSSVVVLYSSLGVSLY